MTPQMLRRHSGAVAPKAMRGATLGVIRGVIRGVILGVVLGAILGVSACAPIVVGGATTAGVTATQDRGIKGAVEDQGLRADIADRWFADDRNAYRGINLQVQQGRVLMTGYVQNPETMVEAVRIAWQAKGVQEIINEVEVRDSGSLGDAAQDTWISTKLRTRLIGDAQIASRNYSIETINGTVYLIGLAQNQAELDRVVAHARDVSYVKRVIDYVRLKDAEATSS